MAQVVLENIYKSFPLRQGEQEKEANSVAESVSPVADSPSSNSVLRRINLTVEDGEFMVLVGPSGCGKSTLLRSIAGLEVLTAGNIWVGDRLVNDLPPKDRDIAMVFQNYALYPHLTVYDNLAFGLRRSEREKEEGRRKKEEGRRKKEEGRGKKEERGFFPLSPLPIWHSWLSQFPALRLWGSQFGWQTCCKVAVKSG